MPVFPVWSGLAVGVTLSLAWGSPGWAQPPEKSVRFLSGLLSAPTAAAFPAPPTQLRVLAGRWRAQDFFATAFELWKREWNPTVVTQLREIAKTGLTQGRLSREQGHLLIARRAEVKLLRFLFVSLSRDHEVPVALDELTISMAKLRAALSKGRPDPIASSSERLSKALRKDSLAKLQASLAGVRTAENAEWEAWVSGAAERSERLIAEPELETSDAREARKNLQAVTATAAVAAALEPDNEEKKRLFRFFRKQADVMGEDADELNLKETGGEVVLPDELKQSAREFLTRLGS